MIAHLTGTVIYLHLNRAVIDVNGVGYEVYCTVRCLQKLQLEEKVSVTIYTDVKEDSIKLFGFEDNLEKQVFLLLMLVKGIGTKTSAEIISKIDKVELLKAISAQDLSRLSNIKGVGKKTAERIILELKDKVREFALGKDSGEISLEGGKMKGAISQPFDEALEALIALGFTRKIAEGALGKIKDINQNDVGLIIKEALKHV